MPSKRGEIAWVWAARMKSSAKTTHFWSAGSGISHLTVPLSFEIPSRPSWVSQQVVWATSAPPPLCTDLVEVDGHVPAGLTHGARWHWASALLALRLCFHLFDWGTSGPHSCHLILPFSERSYIHYIFGHSRTFLHSDGYGTRDGLASLFYRRRNERKKTMWKIKSFQGELGTKTPSMSKTGHTQ